MKRISIFAAGVVFMAAAVSLVVCVGNEKDPIDSLFNANAAALADTEMNVKGYCSDSNNYNCMEIE